MQDLLSALFQNMPKKREDLASDILTLLLREVPGQKVLYALLGDPPSTSLHVDNRKKLGGICNPDVQVRYNGHLAMILEAKFGADLTEAQKNGAYSEHADKVFFVVPEKRTKTLFKKIDRSHWKTPSEILSWKTLLEQLDTAWVTFAPDDFLFKGALDHLKEFCNVSESLVFDPLTEDQLMDSKINETVRHCIWLVDECLDKAREENLITFQKEAKGNFGGSFFYGKDIQIAELNAWLGYWPSAWSKHSELGPIWLQFPSAAALQVRSFFPNGRSIEGNDFAVPLLPSKRPDVHTQAEEVNYLVSVIREIYSRLPR